LNLLGVRVEAASITTVMFVFQRVEVERLLVSEQSTLEIVMVLKDMSVFVVYGSHSGELIDQCCE
jgi:hypothetical protein